MKNFLTFRIESVLGGIFVLAIAGFFVGYMYVSVENFNTDVSLMDSNNVQLKSVNETERGLIDLWVRENNVIIPPDLGYRYLIREFPNKPWLTN